MVWYILWAVGGAGELVAQILVGVFLWHMGDYNILGARVQDQQNREAFLAVLFFNNFHFFFSDDDKTFQPSVLGAVISERINNIFNQCGR